jgi:hypothetical protein
MLDILFAGFALPSRFVKQLNIVRDFSLTLSGRLLGELTTEQGKSRTFWKIFN